MNPAQWLQLFPERVTMHALQYTLWTLFLGVVSLAESPVTIVRPVDYPPYGNGNIVSGKRYFLSKMLPGYLSLLWFGASFQKFWMFIFFFREIQPHPSPRSPFACMASLSPLLCLTPICVCISSIIFSCRYFILCIYIFIYIYTYIYIYIYVYMLGSGSEGYDTIETSEASWGISFSYFYTWLIFSH